MPWIVNKIARLRAFFYYFRPLLASRLGLYFLNVTLLFFLMILWGRGVPVAPIDPSQSYQNDIDYAIETFNYLHDQKNGKIKLKSLDDGPIEIKKHSCWLQRVEKTINITMSHKYWQILESGDDEIYLYKAYTDMRHSHLFPKARGAVQILLMARRKLASKIYCQMWTSDSKLAVVEGFGREIWQRMWDPRNRFYVPVLVTCPIQEEHTAITQVSLALNPCDNVNNLLDVYGLEEYRQNRTAKVVVCVKGMDFLSDLSLRLVEWLELQYMLGADRVVIYTYTVHPKIGRVLDFYAKNRNLLQVPLSLPGAQPNLPYQRSNFIWRNRQQKRRNEIIPYNDCLYRHLYTHKYALIVDTDEAVVPVAHGNWPEMLDALENASREQGKWTAFSITNVFKFDNLSVANDSAMPSYMHMLQHRMRSEKISEPGSYGKSFMYLNNLVTLFNHYPLHKLHPNLYRTKFVSNDLALKLHYKATCPVESTPECPDLYKRKTEDLSLDKYAAELIKRVTDVVERLKLE